MDFSSAKRRPATTVTYGKRARHNGSSPAQAAKKAELDAASTDSDFSDPSDDETVQGRRHIRTNSNNHSPIASSSRIVTPKESSNNVKSRSLSSKISSIKTPISTGTTPKSPTKLYSTSAPTATSASVHTPANQLPRPPPRAASPSLSQPATASAPAPGPSVLRRSVSTSPRKAGASVSPSKRQVRSKTPTRPAKDLGSLFDLIGTSLPDARNPFSRSESQPVVSLHQRDPVESQETLQYDSLPDRPLSPTRDVASGIEDILSPGTLSSPTKRAKLTERMAPRVVKLHANRSGDHEDNLSQRVGSLRRTRTDPNASILQESDQADSISTYSREGDQDKPLSARVTEDDNKSHKLSEVGSTRGEETQSQEDGGIGTSSSSLVRRLAGIKQTAASNAKRTYGLQRSFLADHAEETLLADTDSQEHAKTSSHGIDRNIEDEIEEQIRGGGWGGEHGAAGGGRTMGSSSNNRRSGSSASAISISALRNPASASALPQRESYADLLKKWGEGADDIEWDESQDPTLNLKSITSLRSVGELRRFNDDLEYLFSGLGSSQSMSVRKSSAVEFIRLLCGKPDTAALDDSDEVNDGEGNLAAAQSAEFLRKLKATEGIVRVFDLFTEAEAGQGVDDVLDAALGIYLAKLLNTGGTAEVLVRERWPQLRKLLGDMLSRAGLPSRQERRDGFAALRLQELSLHKISSKADRHTLKELRAIARISKLFLFGSTNLTLRNLLLGALCSIIALPRRLLSEDVIDDLLKDVHAEQGFHSSLFSTVLTILGKEGSKAGARLVDFSKGLDLISPSTIDSAPDLDSVDLCIRFMDKSMEVLYLELDRSVPADSDLFSNVLNMLFLALQASLFDPAELHRQTSNNLGDGHGEDDDEVDQSQRINARDRPLHVLHGLFKVLLDLSQVDPNWSEVLSCSAALHEVLIRSLLLSHQCAAKIRATARARLETNNTLPDFVSEANGQDDDNKAMILSDDIDGDAETRGQRDYDGSIGEGGDMRSRLATALYEDVVHLSLAVLTNLLIKQSDKTRDTFVSVSVNPTCWGKRACAQSCECDQRTPILNVLARLFFETRGVAMREDDSNSAYLSNSIATALAQFAVGGATRLSLCRAALDKEAGAMELDPLVALLRDSGSSFTPSQLLGNSSSKKRKNKGAKVDGFGVLLQAVEEFAAIHEAALMVEQHQPGPAEMTPDEHTEDMAELSDVMPGTKSAEQPIHEPMAVEAGQLIKDLAHSLRNMAH